MGDQVSMKLHRNDTLSKTSKILDFPESPELLSLEFEKLLEFAVFGSVYT